MSTRARTALGLAGIVLGLALRPSDSFAQTVEVVHSFRAGGDSRAILLRASDGYYYGTAFFEGEENLGSIFRVDPSGHIVTLHSFHGLDGANPTGALIEGSDGYFYGTTTNGGGFLYYGTVFRMDAEGTITTLFSFHFDDDGGFPYAGLVEASDGNFYGTTDEGGTGGAGTVFRITPDGNLLTLHSFQVTDGAGPAAALIQGTDGLLYGTTASGGDFGGGTVFKLTTAGAFTSLHSFDGNQQPGDPLAPLVQAADGFFYGTGTAGGSPGGGSHGAAFRMDSSGNVTTIHFFTYFDPQPQSPLTIGADGFFYGTTLFTVFRMDTSGNTTTLHTFQIGEAVRLQGVVETGDGGLLGTAQQGCAGDRGCVFRIDSSGTPTILLAFDAGDGSVPPAGVVLGSDGFLYGTTQFGGRLQTGNVFKMTLAGDSVSLHDFDPSEKFPAAGVTEGSDGALYGLTGSYGTPVTIYRLTRTGVETPVHVFGAEQLSVPAPLVSAADGSLYGVTQDTSGVSTSFKIVPPAAYSPLHQFSTQEGAGVNGFIDGGDGFLYGTANGGPFASPGTVFRMTTSGAVTVLHTFAATEGYPLAPLVRASNGDFYGTTYTGGALGTGTVFRISAGGSYTTLHELGQFEGANPSGALVEAPNGWLYGTTSAAPGTLFRVHPVTGVFETVHAFDGYDGANPQAGLILGSDGHLYGATPNAGPGRGDVFRVILAAFAATRVSPGSASAAGGDQVFVRGAGFDATASVNMGGTPAAATFVDATRLAVVTPGLAPGSLSDVVVTLGSNTSTLSAAYFADFLDVPEGAALHDAVERLVRHGVSAGCGGGQFCPAAPLSRAQSAVLLLKSEHGASYAPPHCTGVFDDVSCPGPFTDWVEALAAEGVTGGCGNNNFCPDDAVTRQQFSVLALKSLRGPAFVPPVCQNVFGDVACPSPFADWIEEFFHEGITAGCQANPPLFCPTSPVTRGTAAALLGNTFKLP